MAVVNKRLLPEGHHFGIHCEHDLSTDGGRFTGGGWKLVWHTTEGLDLPTMVKVLKDKRAEPHVVIGIHGTDRKDFTAIQLLSFDQAGRALEHPSGTMETNNANAIQVEICENAGNAPHWSSELIDALAALSLLIEHRVDIPRVAPRHFSDIPNRFTPAQWIAERGHVGHEHAPSQPGGHWDPGAMKIREVFKAMIKVAE